MDSADHHDLIATSAFGLEAIVARELAALGYEAKPGETGRVHFRGDLSAICRTNLWLRCADRVVVVLGSFDATDFGELFDGIRDMPWENWIPADGAFPVRGRSVRSQLSSVPACQKIAKKAVVERLRDRHGTQKLVETGPTHAIEVALLKDRVTLTLDTTGPGLHRRGYRTLVGAAQLRETLAAALVLLSYWKPGRPLMDPFCGTGTIPIEAALIGRNLAPGQHRSFAAEQFGVFPGELWQAARDEARSSATAGQPLEILATDREENELSLARHHARAAGVEDAIHFQRKEFAQVRSQKRYGCVITNPPYGQRLGEQREVRDLMRTFPDVLRRLPTWSHYVLTAQPGFEEIIGRKADRRRKLYNARIECTYYQFHGPRPPRDQQPVQADQQPAPVFGGISERSRQQAELFRNRLQKRARHLRRWPTRRGVSCFRLYDRDVPEIPLVVDRYGDCLHITEYERPHEHALGEHADWLELMARTAADALECRQRDTFLKRRTRQRGATQYQVMSDERRTYVVEEGGLKFEINLSDYVDTGLFLDHRQARAMIRERAAGKRFLNLFCYTGSFSVYAAAGGAAETTSVDLSRTYLDWARRNLELNGFAGAEHRLVQKDVRAFLGELPAKRSYDLIVLDPPTFSNSKAMDRLFEVRRDHPELIRLTLDHLAEDGELFFSTNFKSFRMEEGAIPAGFQATEITAQTLPEDFRNRRIHRAWIIRREPAAREPTP